MRSWKVIDVVVRTPDFYVTFFLAGGLDNVLHGNGQRRGTFWDCTWHERDNWFWVKGSWLDLTKCINIMTLYKLSILFMHFYFRLWLLLYLYRLWQTHHSSCSRTAGFFAEGCHKVVTVNLETWKFDWHANQIWQELKWIFLKHCQRFHRPLLALLALPADCFLDLGRLVLVLEPLSQGIILRKKSEIVGESFLQLWKTDFEEINLYKQTFSDKDWSNRQD